MRDRRSGEIFGLRGIDFCHVFSTHRGHKDKEEHRILDAARQGERDDCQDQLNGMAPALRSFPAAQHEDERVESDAKCDEHCGTRTIVIVL